MKNKDVLLLAQELPRLSLPDMDRWFNYAVQETIELASSKAKSIREIIKPQEGMVKYQDKAKELQIKHANKDEYGEPIKTTEQIGDRILEIFDIPEINNPKGAFNVAAEKLELEYKEEIDKYKKGLEFLEEECPNFEPYWTTIDLIPNGLTRNEMSVVFLMIKKPEQKA